MNNFTEYSNPTGSPFYFPWRLLFVFIAITVHHLPLSAQQNNRDASIPPVTSSSWFDEKRTDALPLTHPSHIPQTSAPNTSTVPLGHVMSFSDSNSDRLGDDDVRHSQYQQPLLPGSPLPLFSQRAPVLPFSNFGLTAPLYQAQEIPAIDFEARLLPPELKPGIELKEKSSSSPTVNLTGQIQADFVTNSQSDANLLTLGPIPEGAFFRRARMGFFGEAYERLEYRLEFDFAGEARPRFLDLWVALTDIPVLKNVIVGQFFEPFSLERYSPNRFITFTERSLGDTFAPARNMGVMIYGNALNERVTWALGGFRDDSDDYGADLAFNNKGYAATAHATVLPWYEEVDECTLKLMHLGSSFSYRVPDDGSVRFASRPSARLFQQDVGGIPVFTDTGVIADVDRYTLMGIEAAIVHGPFSVQSEYMASQISRAGGADPYLHGGYVYGSWFLTGESRSYSPTSILGRFREGIFQRTAPRNNFFYNTEGQGRLGLGAIELAVRYSYIDLNSMDVRGGSIHEMTYGVNWYWNPYTKVMFNYVKPHLKDADLGQSQADFYVFRMQFEF